jgi:hypothetical protein
MYRLCGCGYSRDMENMKLFPLYDGLYTAHPKLRFAVICILALAAIALAVYMDPH